MFKKRVHTAGDLIKTYLSGEASKLRSDHMVLQLKEGRQIIDTADLYFKEGEVYAAFIRSKPYPLARRIDTSGEMTVDDYNDLIRRLDGDYDPSIIQKILIEKTFPNRLALQYIKEYFLEAMQEILAWETCTATVNPNKKIDHLTIPPVSVEQLEGIFQKRESDMALFLNLCAHYFTKSDLENLTFAAKSIPANLSYEGKQILELCDRQHTIKDISSKLGYAWYPALKSLVSLWKEGNIDIHFKGEDISLTDAKASQESGFSNLGTRKKHEALNESLPTLEALKEANPQRPQELDTPSELAEPVAITETELPTPENLPEDVSDLSSLKTEPVSEESEEADLPSETDEQESDVPSETENLDEESSVVVEETGNESTEPEEADVEADEVPLEADEADEIPLEADEAPLDEVTPPVSAVDKSLLIRIAALNSALDRLQSARLDIERKRLELIDALTLVDEELHANDRQADFLNAQIDELMENISVSV